MGVPAIHGPAQAGRPGGRLTHLPLTISDSPLLILTADDFGSSPRANAAILRAHREGVLAAAEAITLARQHPTLRVGLHLVLADGRSALGPDRVPALVDGAGRFPASLVVAGVRYGLRPRARAQLAEEIAAQFDRFAATGLPLDHVSGHHHLHLHPAVRDLVLGEAERRGAHGVRVTRDHLRLALRWERRGLLVRAAHAAILGELARRWRGAARRRPGAGPARGEDGGGARSGKGGGVRHVERVYGVLQAGEMTEAYLLWLLEEIPRADAEIFFHPGAERGAMRDGGPDLETQALVSPVVRTAIGARGFRTGGYTDLEIGRAHV